MTEALNLRENLQEIYQAAVKNNQPTITAAPFFSLKTATIKQALRSTEDAFIFDLRLGVEALKLRPNLQHIFLDSIEVLPLNKLARLVSEIQNEDKVAHLVTHLYYYDQIQDMLDQPLRIFPQLLNSNDLTKLKAIFVNYPDNEKTIIHSFIDYFEGLPAVVHILDSAKKLEILKQFAAALQRSPNAVPDEYFKKLAEKYLNFFLAVLRQQKIPDTKIAKETFSLAKNNLKRFIAGQLDLKNLVAASGPKLWPPVKYGYLWLDEEKAQLRVPRPIAELA